MRVPVGVTPKSRSHLNPFFGYPVGADLHTLRHGRRRKRDLARTLIVLWWERNRTTIQACISIVSVLLVVRLTKSGVSVRERFGVGSNRWKPLVAAGLTK